MLNALSICLRGCDPGGRLRASESFARQGFVPAASFDWEDGALHGWANPTQSGVEDAILRTPSGFACCVGPLWYRGRFGTAALRLLVEEAGEDRHMDETELRGNFALFLCKDKHCVLMNDSLGLVRLYASADQLFHSTSWLATCAYTGRVSLNEHAAAEYVLLGASHSDQTVARGISTLPLGHVFDLTQRRLLPRFSVCSWTDVQVPATFEDAVDQAESLLRAVFRETAAAFPERVRMALSGGFDSRLIVAGLLACGTRPHLFVYGGAESEDVPIARAIANSMGIPLDVVDKGVLNKGRAAPDVERLVQNGLFFDGLPSDGIYDPGADQQTRLESTAGGRLALNGGGGEIFRNFFHLPNRPLRAIDIVRTFYRGFDPEVFRRHDGLSAWQDRLVASIESVLGTDGAASHRKLTREHVELIYPLFRCHHWMGVNNSVANRHGYYATPLVDVNTVRLAGSLPLAWKNAGRLQSRVLSKLHHGIANQPSAYGFRFSDGPDWRARFMEWTTCTRPVSARPFINATRRRLKSLGVTPVMLTHCRSLLPGEWRLDPVLNLERLPDDVALARALAVEVAWRELLA